MRMTTHSYFEDIFCNVLSFTATGEWWKVITIVTDQKDCVQGHNTELTWISYPNLMKPYSGYVTLPRQQQQIISFVSSRIAHRPNTSILISKQKQWQNREISSDKQKASL